MNFDQSRVISSGELISLHGKFSPKKQALLTLHRFKKRCSWFSRGAKIWTKKLLRSWSRLTGPLPATSSIGLRSGKLIARAENDKDRRARLVSLTARGKSLSEKLRPIAQRAAERLLAPLSPLERSEFIRLLRKITGLADPFDQATTAPPNATRLSGKQILCVGLSDAFGQTIVQRLQLDGAQVIESPLPDLETCPIPVLHESLNQIIENNDGIDTLVNGGNLQTELVQADPGHAYTRIQALASARWLTLTRLLPHFLAKGHGRVINLALFPAAGVLEWHHAATAVANSSIISLSKQIANDYRH